jgi:hypothetical protein
MLGRPKFAASLPIYCAVQRAAKRGRFVIEPTPPFELQTSCAVILSLKKMAGTDVPASGSQEEPGEDPAAVF